MSHPSGTRPPGPSAEPRVAQLESRLAERTADLQRVKAEYDNYRKRVRRDRLAVGQIAVVNVLRELVPVLDIVDGARRHGDPGGAFDVVSDALARHLAALGLRSFGEVGDPFDPTVHQAVTQCRSPGVERAMCAEILRTGYAVGDQLLRPAEVVVAAPPTA